MEATKINSQKEKRCEKFVKKISTVVKFPEKEEFDVLLINKIHVPETISPTLRAIKTIQNFSLNIYLEDSAIPDIKSKDEGNILSLPNVKIFKQIDHEHLIDAVVTIGGDGTILWACSLFQSRLVPPIITFGMGTLGFLCNYYVTEIESTLQCIMNDIIKKRSINVERKMRLKGIIDYSDENPNPTIEFHSLNDIVIDRGPSPIFTSLDIYLNDTLLTVSSGDGLIFSTPTGSTAYSLSAGGPIVHNYLRTIMVVPICPHSLSFRSLLLPSDVNIKIKLSQDSRCKTASVSGDGRNSYEIKREDTLTITSSQFDAQIVCHNPDLAFDKWIEKLQKILMWNSRFIKL